MIKSLIQSRLIQYLLISCGVTVLDYIVTIFLMKQGLNLVYANVMGMVMGTLTQFILLYSLVYKIKITFNEFVKFESTFFFGLIVSTLILWMSYEILHFSAQIAKVLAIIVTFFILYAVREKLIGQVTEV